MVNLKYIWEHGKVGGSLNFRSPVPWHHLALLCLRRPVHLALLGSLTPIQISV